jgi:hypothetical protein
MKDIGIRALISSISHETIHAVLDDEIGLEASIKYDNICFLCDDIWIFDFIQKMIGRLKWAIKE